MVTLLSKLFIKRRGDVKEPSVRRAYGVLCGLLGVFFNVLLFTGKFIAGTLAKSVSITADAFNNLSDAGSSIVTLLGFKIAGQKPDPTHPFGHGRMEYISGLVVAMIIVVMGFELLVSSVKKIITPVPIEFSWLSAAILVASILIKAYMAFYNRNTGRRIDSVAMKAISLDSLTDCIATFTVLGSLLMSRFFNVNIDGWCGAAVSLFILYSGLSAAKDTINPLLGNPPEKEFVSEITSTVLAHPEVIGVHDLIVHDYGPGRMMLSLHAEVSADGEILVLHDVIDNIERELRSKFGCDAVIHMDPVVRDNALSDSLKQRVIALVRDIDPCISIHDFRVVAGPTHTNLIFDVVLPYKFRLSDAEVCKLLHVEIEAMDGGKYFAVITIDKAYA